MQRRAPASTGTSSNQEVTRQKFSFKNFAQLVVKIKPDLYHEYVENQMAV